MRIDTEFQVNAPAEKVWDYLLKVEEVATCVPGAEILEKVSDDEFSGRVTVKVGPLGLNLQGTAIIESRDIEARVLTISGKGKDQQGRGTADASVIVRVHEADADNTRVEIEQDLRVTGRIAQFGRGVMKDLSQRLAQDFSRCLEAKIAADSAASQVATAAAGAGDVAAPRPQPAQPQAAKPVSGLRLLTWALSRAVARLFRRMTGHASAAE
jgi:carbon monoxide dehydrogenase subunit G